jgi:hypothetical protein
VINVHKYTYVIIRRGSFKNGERKVVDGTISLLIFFGILFDAAQ